MRANTLNLLHSRCRTGLVYLGLLFMGACVHKPLDPTAVTRGLTPESVQHVKTPENPPNHLGENVGENTLVIWGGVILDSVNENDETRLEVLSYPLDYIQRPVVSRTATGRFIVVHPGYLETLDFAPGRMVTIRGNVTGSETGKVGEAEYQYARVTSDDLHLWQEQYNHHWPYFTFGLSISISN